MYKYLTILTVYFVSILLVSNIVSVKVVSWGWMSWDAGTLLFPLSYIIGDILTEVYGYAQARRVIWMGMFSQLLLGIVVILVGLLPSDPSWAHQDAYMTILGFTPRLVIASMIAYVVGEFINSFVLAKLKIWTNGSQLWLRTIGSTVIGQIFDTLLFVMIAFYGVFDMQTFWVIVISNYVLKVIIEVCTTPVLYRLVPKIKKAEGVDHYDRDTNFSPLRF